MHGFGSTYEAETIYMILLLSSIKPFCKERVFINFHGSFFSVLIINIKKINHKSVRTVTFE